MSKTLLLADDSVVIQKLVGLSFANEDIEIISTDNGDDAVARAREIRPDIILADVVMPGLSGYEVCEAIKQDAELAHIPVLLLTGTFEAFDEARAASTGANGQITKPFEAQALVDRVIEVMNAPVVTPVAEIAPAPPSLPPVKAPIAADVSEAIPVGPAGPIHSKRAPAKDFFDRDVGSLSGAAEDISLDRTPTLPVGDAFPVEVDPNETTSSALFGAPGQGATDDFDTEGGNMALGHSVTGESAGSPAGIDANAEPRIVSGPDTAGSALTQDKTPLAPLSESTAHPNAAPLAEPITSQPTHDPLPAARPVDLDTALADTPAGPLSSDPDTTIMVGTADTNAETSPAMATDSWDRPEPTIAASRDSSAPAASGNTRNPQRRHDDLLVHVPSEDIDADHAAAPSPPATGSDAPRPDETVVADLDASLDMSPEDADLAFPDSPDPLDFGPNSVPPDDLDFAFDVSEQVAAENSADPRTEAFASLDDISESQILGAGRVDDSDSGRPLPTARAVDARVSHDAPTIVSGYDVSTSDLATASTTASGIATPPPIPEPEHLDVLPELPQSHPRTTPEASTPDRPPVPARADDFFEGLATGSPLDEIATPTEFTSGSDLDANEDLLDEDFSVEIGEPIPANPETSSRTNDREPLVEVDPIEAADENDYDVPEEIETIEPIEDAAPSASDDDLMDEGIDIAEDITDDDSDEDAGFAQDSEFAIGSAAAASAFGPNAAEDRRVPDLSPVMEQRIQETLEKVAWEAFSDLSESIVKQVMGRVEQIAWEVIPEMAETLVREEIRKMKGEDD